MDATLDLNFSKAFAGFQLSVKAQLPAGIVAVFGPSGSGKTTLLNCVAGLLTPDDGHIALQCDTMFSKRNGVNLPPERRRVGYLFQDSLLFPHLSVADNIHFGYRLASPSRRRIDPRQVIELLELEPLLNRGVANLSGGERQRVALARALAASPRLLLLDEPLASLHQSIKGRILRYLKAIHAELAVPMLYVSHSISEALALANVAMALDKGRQVAVGAPQRLLSDHRLGALGGDGSLENLFDVTIDEHRPESGITLASLGDTQLALPLADVPIGAVVTVAIKAADIMLASERPNRVSARNVLEATAVDIQQVGATALVHASLEANWMIEITPDAMESLKLTKGESVHLIIKSNSISLLD